MSGVSLMAGAAAVLTIEAITVFVWLRLTLIAKAQILASREAEAQAKPQLVEVTKPEPVAQKPKARMGRPPKNPQPQPQLEGQEAFPLGERVELPV